jgi:Protein of unknown function (DUF2442)
MAELKAPTVQEFDAITRRTVQRMKHQLLAVDARYDRRNQRVMITLNNGAVVGFPLAVLPGLEQATPDDLRKIEVAGGGYGLHIASLDADISIPTLLEDQLGSTAMRRAVVRRTLPRPTDGWAADLGNRWRLSGGGMGRVLGSVGRIISVRRQT